FLKQPQRLPVLVKRGEEPRVLFSSEPDHAQFRDHDRPAEDGGDGQKNEDEFSCDRCVIKRKEQTAAGRYDFEHARFTCETYTADLQK
ncbi:MAG: hypothetical protein C4293_05735, partial [Nitrospiraceae bacterium]